MGVVTDLVMELPPSRHWLLPFHRAILHRLIPDDDELRDLLVVIAPGLGLRRVLSTLLRVYARPTCLVVVVNASSKDVNGINHDLGTLGLGHSAVRDVHHEMSAKQRADVYVSSGIVSVTSRILIVDMLSKRIPISRITGVVVLHAEQVSPVSIEAFILRVYRQENKDGFVKAFSDNVEQLANGFHKLQTIMSQLRLRQVDIWPRFHQDIDKDLVKRRADVIELHQPLTPRMVSIQNAIIECLEGTLHEIRLSKLAADMEDFDVEHTMYRAFDVAVRRQLEPVWHRLSPSTKQLVGDLNTLRHLLHALLSYDSVSFYIYLETILASNAPSTEAGAFQRQSQWLMTDAANIIFHEARARIWGERQECGDTELVLEELPKWKLLVDVLYEIEQDIYTNSSATSNHTILIMAKSDRTVSQLRMWLSLAEGDFKTPGRSYMKACLNDYFAWKKNLQSFQHESPGKDNNENPASSSTASSTLNEALHRKIMRSGAPAHKRRRVRGGLQQGPSRPIVYENEQAAEWKEKVPNIEVARKTSRVLEKSVEEDWVDDSLDYFGLIDLSHVVIVQSYQDDNDDSLLQELRPRYVIMYDPNAQFVRQVEIYRATQEKTPELKIYFLLYTDSVEEQMYLAALRREKDSFERLIREKATMAIPLTVDGTPAEDADQRMVRMLSTRVAGGQRALPSVRPPSVVVDMREFRSSLPSLLHAAGLQVIPCTLQVGDYVISSEMCVERKSLMDLVQSLTSGRLYTQCESMSMHYPYPILLIEFDHERAFTFQGMGETNPTGSARPITSRTSSLDLDLQSKLALLTLSFPRLRLIWSSSPYASVEILSDLKQNYDEPDPAHAAAIGLDDLSERHSQEMAIHATSMEMLRAMPGVTVKNSAYIARKIPHIHSLSDASVTELQGLIGSEPGRKLHDFLHRRFIAS